MKKKTLESIYLACKILNHNSLGSCIIFQTRLEGDIATADRAAAMEFFWSIALILINFFMQKDMPTSHLVLLKGLKLTF
jgi:hypothetical protein